MRRPQVTRSVIVTDYKCVVLNLNKGTAETKTYRLTGHESTDKKALEKLKNKYDTESINIVTIKETEPKIVTYVMDLDKFIAGAEEKEKEQN